MNIRLAGIAFYLLALSAPARGQEAERSALVHVAQTGPQAEAIKKTLDRIKLPPGFKIRLYALVPGARHMAVGLQGKVIFAGTAETKVYAVTVDAASGVAGGVSEFAPAIGMNAPNGVCFAKDGVLYVAEVNRVLSFPRAEADYQNPSIRAKVIVGQDKLIPAEDEGTGHNLRVCRAGPDNKLYIALGQPYNVPPHEKMPEFNKWGIGGIIRMNLDGTDSEVFARGIRNSVGMDFNPKDEILWFTDNQVDGMGDDIPPEELNRAPQAGLNFGFPWYGGGHTRTGEYKNETPPEGLVFPEIETPAHATDLGMAFYTGTNFPAKYRGGIFFAQHGSWNRTVPIGAGVMFASLKPDGTGDKAEVFAEGWLNEKGAYDGRPVDVAELQDGSLIVSDDFAGALYRITYEGNEGAMPPK
ncbi:MAG: PQQ-dependent sugar dehydrogenase [Pseudomonadota bacterium]|nr:PQQ-dependent sugar dehydrogenase [Pseudomonadota bacterium]